MRNLSLALPLALALCLAALAAHAEEVAATLAVATADARGQPVRADMALTLFVPPGKGPHPAVVLSHGRPGAAQRAGMGRVKLTAVTTAFLGKGFVVAVPTRIGYGATGGPDVESSLSCEHPAYPQTFAAAADQVEAAAKYVRTLPYVDRDRLFLVGHSMGGAATVAAAVRNLPGVKAAVAFAGGQGAQAASPGEPCGAAVLKDTFAAYGAARSPVPQLWMHVENDRQFSLAHARGWFAAFEQAGGKGQFSAHPAFRTDGHWWFASEPAAWMPEVLAFIEGHGGGGSSSSGGEGAGDGHGHSPGPDRATR